MNPKRQRRNILISFDISSIAGRDQLSGVLKYLRKKPNWVPRLITQSRDLTPELIRDANREKFDGNVPHSVAILGVDNDPLICDAANPALSSVPFDYEKQGYEAVAKPCGRGEVLQLPLMNRLPRWKRS